MSSVSAPTGSDLPDERHSVPSLSVVHTGDLCRVTSEDGETVLDPTSTIAVWPYTQEDIDAERHRDDLRVKEYRTRDETAEDPEWETVEKLKSNGIRVTFATRGGGRYAAINWAGTTDGTLLYVLVIGGDPDSRRWERVGELGTLERYGPRVDDVSPEYHGRMPSEDIPAWEVEQDAEPDFNTLGGVHDER